MNKMNFFVVKRSAIMVLKKLRIYNLVYSLYVYIRYQDAVGRHGGDNNYFSRFLKQLDIVKDDCQEKTVLFYGSMLDKRKKAIYQIIRQLQKKEQPPSILVMHNGIRLGKTQRRIKDILAPVNLLCFPECGEGEFDRNLIPKMGEAEKNLFTSKKYLRYAAENLSFLFPNQPEDVLQSLVCEYYKCYLAVLEEIDIKTAVIWNEFHTCQSIFSEMCYERGVKVVFAEFGALPGTIVFDKTGQMGESWPAVFPDKFNALSVTTQDYQKAEAIIRILRSNKLNRNVQPINRHQKTLEQKVENGKPTVLFAGQYDVDSGMVPYTEKTKHFHSPCFKSSDEAMRCVAEIAKRHDWNFIYKPHPLAQKYEKRYRKAESNGVKLPDNVIYIEEYNINDIIDMADVVVTILSTTAYISLIRETATLMLGYNQISKKGCCYEAFDRDQIEQQLKLAVKNGFTAEQKKSFIRHVAQMEKYYLYSDGEEHSGMVWGKPIDEAVNLIEKL